MPFFGGMRATQITTPKVKEYILSRLSENASNGTINRELTNLKTMFNLASKCTPPKVGSIPYVPKLKESNVRTGFFEHVDYEALMAVLPDYLKPMVAFAYRTGWRRGEISGLTWDQVDLKENIVRLEVGSTKNDREVAVFIWIRSFGKSCASSL